MAMHHPAEHDDYHRDTSVQNDRPAAGTAWGFAGVLALLLFGFLLLVLGTSNPTNVVTTETDANTGSAARVMPPITQPAPAPLP